jgi:hypothetical protein
VLDDDTPPPPPPPPLPHPIGVLMGGPGKARKKRPSAWVVFSDGSVREVRSPFQRPAYRGIAAAVYDLDGDGILETLGFTARKGRKKVVRLMPL